MAKLLMKLTQEQGGRLYIRKFDLEDKHSEFKIKTGKMEDARGRNYNKRKNL